ncbi:hypothetical protein HanIR_Chr11g0555011 [Helianthus annuus]|nr:hypothetical protein HanIR_Chr11g0555011 [Helianthus annuus]
MHTYTSILSPKLFKILVCEHRSGCPMLSCVSIYRVLVILSRVATCSYSSTHLRDAGLRMESFATDCFAGV